MKNVIDLLLEHIYWSELNASILPWKWLFFGNQGIIAQNVRHEQRKVVKYNQLVANLTILRNVEAMTGVLKEMQEEGCPINEEILAGLAPYRTEHTNRFGDYTLDLDR